MEKERKIKEYEFINGRNVLQIKTGKNDFERYAYSDEDYEKIKSNMEEIAKQLKIINESEEIIQEINEENNRNGAKMTLPNFGYFILFVIINHPLLVLATIGLSMLVYIPRIIKNNKERKQEEDKIKGAEIIYDDEIERFNLNQERLDFKLIDNVTVFEPPSNLRVKKIVDEKGEVTYKVNQSKGPIEFDPPTESFIKKTRR